jgi:poly(hydroxyalkanoate) depolymerase family esterase
MTQPAQQTPATPTVGQVRQPRWEVFPYTSDAGSRPYYVYTPATHDPGAVVPLLVMLHGCTQTARGVAVATDWNRLAEEHGFVVVYPQQTTQVPRQPTTGQGPAGRAGPPDGRWDEGNPDHCWNWFLPEHQARETGEPAVIAGITRAVMGGGWRIDPDRVFVAGMSAGAAMAVNLGATHPDLYAAVGVHSGVEYQAATTVLEAVEVLLRGGPDPVTQGRAAFQAMGDHARLVPVIVIHGSADRRVNPVNGDQVVQQWMETNRLATGGAYQARFDQPARLLQENEPVPGGRPYTVAGWTGANGQVVQEYWKIDGMPHAWTGGFWLGSFADPRGPSASRAMYAFFSRQHLRPATKGPQAQVP